MTMQPGARVHHNEFGQGAVITITGDFATVFFPLGEKRVPIKELSQALSHNESVVRQAKGGSQRLKKSWLCYKAHLLPLLENATSMTSARIDLLPHQVVLTHKVATLRMIRIFECKAA